MPAISGFSISGFGKIYFPVVGLAPVVGPVPVVGLVIVLFSQLDTGISIFAVRFASINLT